MENKKLKGLARFRYIFFLLRPYWNYGKVYVVVTIVMAMVLQPLSAYLATMLPQRAIDALMSGAPRNDILFTIMLYTLGVALVTMVQMVFERAYSRLAQMRIDLRIKNDVNEKALFTDFKYYDNPDFFTRFIFAQEKFPQQSLMAMRLFPEILKAIMTVTAMGAIIAMAGPALIGVTMVFILLSAVLGFPTMKPQADLQMQLTENWRPFEYVQRMLKQKENAAELRSSGAGPKFLVKVNSVIERNHLTYRTFLKKTLPYFLAQGVVSPIQTACVLAYVIFFVINGDTTKIGLYASLTVASASMVSNLSDFGDIVGKLWQNTLFGERISAFFEAKSIIEPPRENASAPPEGVFEIELRDVSFSYDKAMFGIENLNLHIKPGQRIAIVGENGAGKTTLTKLLLRLYDVNNGSVRINGRDIKEYDIHKLRLRIGVAFQDVRVLAMSLRDNLTVYNDLDDDQLLQVIKKLGLEGVLKKAGNDLDKMVSREFTQDGIALSGGEAQRLTLARLFTGSFGVLVLDEPSSALDPLAEYQLMQTILDASNNATTIMIAHRLSTVRDFDIIHHMDNGHIIESGSHEELMSAQGKYYEMFVRQAEKYQSL